MAKRKSEVEVVTPEVTEEAAHTSRKTEVTIAWGNSSRTYSEKVHGPSFAELAEEFRAKKNGRVV